MGIGAMGVMHPQLVMRNIIPVVMAGVLGIYGLIVSVILLGSSESAGPLVVVVASCVRCVGGSASDAASCVAPTCVYLRRFFDPLPPSPST